MARYKEGSIFANRYRLVEFLGNGKDTEVWHAYDIFASVNVAVKLNFDRDTNGDVIKKFAMVYDLIHSNILHPLYINSFDRITYEVMPYCKQGNVSQYILNNKIVKEDFCWQLLHDISSALAYLHTHHPPILHLDIKPDNVLIHDTGRFMLTDFGISDYWHAERMAVVNGTMSYMAPERFQEDSSTVKASDIWSLGAMMFEVMNGGILPYGETGGSAQSLEDDYFPQFIGEYSPELTQIVSKCMEYYTWDRPTANDIALFTLNKLKNITSKSKV